MATWRVNNSTSLGGEVCAVWQANHAYGLGARVVCRVAYGTQAARAFVYECTSAGTSHATTEPSWPTTVGNTVVDNGATWTCRSPSDGSWDNASCYLFYVTNHAAAAGDTIYIDDGHSEAGIGATMTIAGATSVNSKKIYCVDKASDALSTGATVASGNQIIDFTGCAYSYGVHYNSGTGYMRFGTGAGVKCVWTFESNNTLVLTCNGTTGIVAYTTGYETAVLIINANIAAKYVIDLLYFSRFVWRGGSFVDTGVTAGSKLFNFNGMHSHAIVEDVDLSAYGAGASAVYLMTTSSGVRDINVNFTRCKLPTDAGFAVTSGASGYPNSGKIVLRHCSSDNQTYDIYEYSYEGVIEDSTAVYRNSGASNGTTSYSLKMVSSSGGVENIIALESIPITGWTSSTTSKTFTVEGVWDSATNIQDDEIWMELEYPANNTDGLGAIAKDKCAILGTPADQTASTKTWTGTGGFSNENKFKLSVTVTPGKAGPICARVYLAKASTTVYIDPLITES